MDALPVADIDPTVGFENANEIGLALYTGLCKLFALSWICTVDDPDRYAIPLMYFKLADDTLAVAETVWSG